MNMGMSIETSYLPHFWSSFSLQWFWIQPNYLQWLLCGLCINNHLLLKIYYKLFYKATASTCWYIWSHLVLTGMFSGLPIGTRDRCFVLFAREYPVDLLFQSVWQQGMTYSLLQLLPTKTRSLFSSPRRAGMLVKGKEKFQAKRYS